MLKIDSLTRSEVGRRACVFGVNNLRPFDVPLIMRIAYLNSKSQITILKSQTNFNPQFPNGQNGKSPLPWREGKKGMEEGEIISNIIDYNLFVIWCL
jgi:hypothetical protein